jgi:hypothetical protein
MTFKQLLQIVLNSSLISDLINIVYSYAKRYNEPKLISKKFYNDQCEFYRFKYEVNDYYWFDHKNDLFYYFTKCDEVVPYSYYSVGSDNLLDARDIACKIDVHDNIVCVIKQYDHIATFFDKNTLQMLYNIKLHGPIDQFVLLNNNILLTMDYDCECPEHIVSIYNNDKMILSKKYTYYIHCIGANHDNIFMIISEPHDDVECDNDQDTGDDNQNTYDDHVVLMIYDHDLNFIKKHHLSDYYYDVYMRVYDNTIYISSDSHTTCYVMSEM